MKEFIVCSAIYVKTVKVYEGQPRGIDRGFVIQGRRHSDCYATIKCLLMFTGHDEKIIEAIQGQFTREGHGFITSNNRFVDRTEGLKIAVAADQIKYGAKTIDKDNQILISENLY